MKAEDVTVINGGKGNVVVKAIFLHVALNRSMSLVDAQNSL